MELIKCKYKVRCELGACKNFAGSTIKFADAGVHSGIHCCPECLDTLRGLLAAEEKNAEPETQEAAEVSGKQGTPAKQAAKAGRHGKQVL